MVYKSRWVPDEKIRIVLESLNTNITVAELCRKHGIRPPSFYSWREKFFQGGKLALTVQLKDPVREMEAENERLKKLIFEHNYGPKWSVFLKAYISSMIKAATGGEPRVIADDALVTLYPLASS